MSPTTLLFETPSEDEGVLCVFRKGMVSTVLARIVRVDLGLAGNVRCRLKLSLGEVTVYGNRDTIPSSLREGDWVRVRAMRRWREDPAPLRVMSLVAATPDAGAAWVPTTLCHRTAHMRRLLTLLVELAPAMQALFMTAMS